MTTINGIEFHDLSIQKYWQPPKSWTDEKKKTTTQNRIFSNEWIGSRKYDGAFYRFVKYDDGTMELLGRSKGVDGDYLDKIDNVPHLMNFFISLPEGTCLLGEIVYPNNEGSKNTTKVMGALPDTAEKYQEKNGNISYYIFDVLAYDGEVFIDSPIEDRIKYLEGINGEYIFTAKYWRGQELWDNLQEILATGGEGIVMTKADAKYELDKRPSKTCQKVKKELQDTIDAIIIGALPPTKDYAGGETATWKYWEDQRTGEKFCDTKIIEPYMTTESYQHYLHGGTLRPISKLYYLDAAASLRVGVYKDGNIVEIGSVSGVEEDILMNWEKYIGKVVELGAMEIDNESHALRHPRILSWREDKNPKECLWEQLV